MTKIQLPVRIAQMHAVSPAIAEVLAVGAIAFPHPFAVSVGLETVFPYLHEVVLVDVSLVVVRADAGAGRDGAVYQYRAYRHSRLTGKEMIAHIAFVIA